MGWGVAARLRPAKVCAIALALCFSAGCHPPAAVAGAGACAPPPTWRQPGAQPGQPEAELASCLTDKAYQARTVNVPLDSKAAGLIAQCEVEVDQFEGSTVLGGGSGSQEQRAAVEQRAQDEARAAIAAYQACGGA
jgi:hypothetical protein